MAALIDEACAARQEARRLRAETLGLKLSCRERIVTSRERLESAERTALRVQSQRVELLPSPWSTLSWACADDALRSVLVPVV